MKIGTRSLLFGVHAFYLHPWFVALAWWKLYGFPWQPWLWLAFVVHDWGYWGKPNMDGPEGEEHPWLGARIMQRAQCAWWLVSRYRSLGAPQGARPRLPWWAWQRRLMRAHFALVWDWSSWSNQTLYHSRFLAKKHNAKPSRLCFADKLAFPVTPRWLYLLQANATGEIHEYMQDVDRQNPILDKYKSMHMPTKDQLSWHRRVADYVTRWVAEHVDGREDTWTAAA